MPIVRLLVLGSLLEPHFRGRLEPGKAPLFRLQTHEVKVISVHDKTRIPFADLNQSFRCAWLPMDASLVHMNATRRDCMSLYADVSHGPAEQETCEERALISRIPFLPSGNLLSGLQAAIMSYVSITYHSSRDAHLARKW